MGNGVKPVFFLGGNGHCTARLARARRALAEAGAPFDLREVAYPGFEGRPRVPDLVSFLHQIDPQLGDAGSIYGTGIGGLLLLALRARGKLRGRPLVLQAPVLWGLRHRLMPRLVRRLPRAVLPRVFRLSAFRRRFCARHFTSRLTPEEVSAFFAGYDACPALHDLFVWLDAALLVEVETASRRDPTTLDSIELWWGGRDQVVPAEPELRWTTGALGFTWPLRRFPEWGHYPMIDDPAGWVAAIAVAGDGDRAARG